MSNKSLVLTISTLLVLFVGQSAYAQQAKPKWTEGYFEEGANTYLQCIDAYGYDYNDSRAKAVEKIYVERNIAAGTNVSVMINDSNAQVNGKKDLTVKARIIEEYHENLSYGNHRHYLLVQTAKNPTYDFDKVQITDKYGFSPRVFVPGMAQIHKGSVGKGIAFISGEVVFVGGGAIVAESMRKYYDDKSRSTDDSAIALKSSDDANMWTTIRNVSIAGAAAVYIWNVIDGIVAKGEKHIILGDASLNISPYTDFQSTGFALNIKF